MRLKKTLFGNYRAKEVEEYIESLEEGFDSEIRKKNEKIESLHKKMDAETRKLYSKRKGYTKLQNAYASATFLYNSGTLMYIKFVPDNNNYSSNTGKTLIHIQVSSALNIAKYLQEIQMLNRIGD